MNIDVCKCFYGAWICPNESIYWTNDILSHSKVIDELGIRDTLIDASKSMKFSQHEIKQHLNVDLSYIALKLGYVRITSYYNQIGIQYENDSYGCIPHIQQVIGVCKILQDRLYRNGGIEYDCIIVEQLSTTKYKKFVSLNDFFSNLDKI